MKKLGIVIGIIVVIIVLFLIFKNVLIKTAVEQGTKRVTGLELIIGDMDVGLLTSKVDITDMQLLNPIGFPEKIMVDIPEFFVDVELASFFKKRAHVQTLTLNLKELIVVRNKDSILNLSVLKSVSEKQKRAKKPVDQKKRRKSRLIHLY
jgi:uncharacterized protein involved in outer membrane biogenesis